MKLEWKRNKKSARHLFLTIATSINWIASQAFAQEIESARFYTDDDYLMYESPYQENMVVAVGKVRTRVVSVIDNTTTSGLPIKSWVLQTVWEYDAERNRVSWERAIQKNPVWRTWSKAASHPPSRHCKMFFDNPDVKVEQGLRDRTLDATNLVCSVVLHTKNGASAQMNNWVARGEIIDSGIEPVSVKTGSRGVSISAKLLNQKISSFLPAHAQISAGLAGFLMAHAMHEAAKETANTEPLDGFLMQPQNLERNLNVSQNMLFEEKTTGMFVLKSLEPDSQLIFSSEATITFDPQKTQR